MKKDKQRSDGNRKPDPAKVYNDELHSRGKELFDKEEEGDARDLAKVEKANRGIGQKIDSIHPDDLEETMGDSPEERP